jgi:hypothetical protein
MTMITLVHSSLVPTKSIIPTRGVTICLTDGSSKQLPIAKVQMDVGKMSGYYEVGVVDTFILDFSTCFSALCTCFFSSLSIVLLL